ncbi:MAG: hypothetical protein L0Z50_31760, partial [Verrucomicrobiales bacterium]|nr:hypothetical protein [Verrucomicrobiales bacterium]
LEVEFVPIERGSDAIPALLQGDLDVINGTVSPAVLNTAATSAEFKVVADRVSYLPQDCSYTSFVVRKDFLESGALDDPNAKIRTAGSTASISEFLRELAFEHEGISLDRLELLDVPTQATLQALLDGGIDMATLVEPELTRGLQTGEIVIWVQAEEIMANYLFGTVAFGPNLLVENREAGQRFMVAYLKAVRQYNEGKTERNLEIVANATQLDVEFLQAACWPAIRSDGLIDYSSVEAWQQWAISKGYLEAPLTEEQFWDPSFVEFANQVLGGTAP